MKDKVMSSTGGGTTGKPDSQAAKPQLRGFM